MCPEDTLVFDPRGIRQAGLLTLCSCKHGTCSLLAGIKQQLYLDLAPFMRRMLYHVSDNFPAGIKIVHKQKGKNYKKIAKTNKRTCPKAYQSIF